MTNIYPYDLHVHTNVSDGTYSPEEVIDRAVTLGLKGLSITDHDGMFPNLDSLTMDAEKKGIILVPGIEFSTKLSNVHILAYGLNPDCSELQRFVAYEREKRLEAMESMCQKAENLGLSVNIKEVMEYAGNSNTIGRPHLAEILIQKGYAKDIYHAFKKWLKKGQPLYAEYKKYTHSEIIELIKNWKGLPVLAHPAMIGHQIIKKVLKESIEAGIAGLELYYPRLWGKNLNELFDLAKEQNLLITGGSDFHGWNKPDIEMGAAGLNQEDFEHFCRVMGHG